MTTPFDGGPSGMALRGAALVACSSGTWHSHDLTAAKDVNPAAITTAKPAARVALYRVPTGST
ncbi:hypothetical protein SAMN05216199_1446 [Pedococcus cremeus]|uniref:Uncharacterized protein n=1 Tax=Pedococcus cremeus TaxID=587636 RepID=A0A1H9T5Q4_9MICO|nr:hypothetical protein SAMN05216199_1446 [Pedococcus cremeus]